MGRAIVRWSGLPTRSRTPSFRSSMRPTKRFLGGIKIFLYVRPEWALLIKEEVEKQWKAKFLEVVDDTQWLANIVPVPKKDGKVRMCVDYRDLNKACPKDDFPLPHIDTLVDSAASSAMYSFMDGFSGYN